MMHHFTIFIDTFHYFQSRNGKSIASSFKRTLKPRTSTLNTNVLSYDSVPVCDAKETPTFYYFFNHTANFSPKKSTGNPRVAKYTL